MDKLNVRRNAYDRYHRRLQGRLDKRNIQVHADRKASGKLSSDSPNRRFPSYAVTWYKQGSGSRRSNSHGILLIQHADNTGWPQYQDAGYSVFPMGSCRNNIHLSLSTFRRANMERMAPQDAARRDAFRPCPQHADKGEPYPDYILSCNSNSHLRGWASHQPLHKERETPPDSEIFCSICIPCRNRMRRNSNQCEQAHSDV